MPSSTTIGVSEHLPALLLAAGVSLLSFLLLMNLRFKLNRRAASRHISPAFAAGPSDGGAADFEAPHRHHHPPRSSRTAMPATIDNPIAVSAHESVNLLIRELDTRCRTLEVLLRQADERIRQLEDALDDRVGASISPTRTALPERPRKSGGDAVAARAEQSRENADELPSIEIIPADDGLASQRLDPLSVNIYELADRGRSALEIARHLDEQVGKVELILALRGDR